MPRICLENNCSVFYVRMYIYITYIHIYIYIYHIPMCIICSICLCTYIRNYLHILLTYICMMLSMRSRHCCLLRMVQMRGILCVHTYIYYLHISLTYFRMMLRTRSRHCCCYGVATFSRLLRTIGLFCRIPSLL